MGFQISSWVLSVTHFHSKGSARHCCNSACGREVTTTGLAGEMRLSEQNEQVDVQETVLLEELALWRASVGSGCCKGTWRENLTYKYLEVCAFGSSCTEMPLVGCDSP